MRPAGLDPLDTGQMNDRQLRQHCQHLARDLPIPTPFTITTFCQAIAAQRGRPLHLYALPEATPGGPCGVWIATDDGDHVFYEPGTSPLHRDHIILHEIA